MADFEYLKDSITFSSAYTVCQKAEQADDVNEKAALCRDSLIELLSVIYTSRDVECSSSATLVEIINSPVITSFAADESMLKALHFIRKIGNNQKHGIPIKKKESQLSYSNLKDFAFYTFDRIHNPDKPIKKFSFGKFSEADTRKIYIDLYLEEL